MLNPLLRALRKNMRPMAANEVEQDQITSGPQDPDHFSEGLLLMRRREMLNNSDYGNAIKRLIAE